MDGLQEYFDEVTFERGIEPLVEISVFSKDEDASGNVNVSIDDAVVAADAADSAVVVVQDNASELVDRDGMALPERQDELVSPLPMSPIER